MRQILRQAEALVSAVMSGGGIKVLRHQRELWPVTRKLVDAACAANQRVWYSHRHSTWYGNCPGSVDSVAYYLWLADCYGIDIFEEGDCENCDAAVCDDSCYYDY